MVPAVAPTVVPPVMAMAPAIMVVPPAVMPVVMTMPPDVLGEGYVVGRSRKPCGRHQRARGASLRERDHDRETREGHEDEFAHVYPSVAAAAAAADR